MPTYVCSVPNGKLNEKQKQDVASAITKRHCETTGAPPYFVQVVIEEEGTAKRFIGGTATDEYIWIRVDMRDGRSAEQSRQIMLNILNDVSSISGVPEENVWINLCKLAPTDMVEYGHVLPKPGEEQQWFESLPPKLKARLEGLGVRQEKFQL
jgi:phenylpyruvate tautomerase PptA (4-oxalocrotonate tautomerase family)